jgi:hypothetical protein
MRFTRRSMIFIAPLIIALSYILHHIVVTSIIGVAFNRGKYINKLTGIVINKPSFVFNPYNSVSVILSNSIPCGAYAVNTQYDRATMLVGRSTNSIGTLYFHQIKSTDLIQVTKKGDKVFLTDIHRIVSSNNDVIRTFNRGCVGFV